MNAVGSFLGALQAAHQRATDWLARHGRPLRVWGLALALGVFSLGLVWSLRALGARPWSLRLAPLALLLLAAVPSTIVLNTFEFRLMNAAAGRRIGWPKALEVTVHAGLANMLPIPGGFLARIVGMRANGVGVRHGSALVLLVAGLWGALALLMSGAAMPGSGGALEPLLLAGGVTLMASSLWGFLRARTPLRLVSQLMLARLLLLLLESTRLLLCVLTLGASATFRGTSTLVISSFAARLVSIVPAGLGVREAVVAGMAPLAGVDPAVGFTAAALSRVAGLSILLVAGALLLALGRREATARKALVHEQAGRPEDR